MVIVTVGLVCIIWLTQSLRFVELIINKGASIWVFLKITFQIMPRFLVIILPVALFTVTLFTYNKLINDRELLVMRSAGMSHWALARPCLMLALACAGIAFALNLWIIPQTMENFRKMQWELRNNASSVLLHEGEFVEVVKGLTVYVQQMGKDGELLGIAVHDRRDPAQPVTIMAEKGMLIHGDDSLPQVLLVNGSRQQITRGTDRLSLLYFDNYAMEFADSSSGDEVRVRRAAERSTWELFSAAEEDVGAVAYRQYRIEGHQRLASPLYHFSFALIASACLLWGWFNRRGQASRIVIAISMMLIIQSLSLGISNLSVKYIDLVPLIYLNPILTSLGGLAFLLAPSFKGRETSGAKGG